MKASGSQMDDPVRTAAASGPGMHKHSVLIVDDQQDTAEGLQLLLELRGYDGVRVATNGNNALALLHTDYAPCVILLDLFMPGMDGAHFLAAKAADPALAAIPVIAVSGSADPDTVPPGAAVSMLKPVDFDRLLALVTTHCGRAVGVPPPSSRATLRRR